MIKKSDLFTVSSAGRFLGISSQSVRAWVKRGKLPCSLAAGGIRIFHLSDLEKLKKERETKLNAE